MKLDPVQMECAKCKKETTHSVSFAEKAESAGVLSAVCPVCGNSIVLPLTGNGRRPLADSVRQASASGTYKRKIVKPNS